MRKESIGMCNRNQFVGIRKRSVLRVVQCLLCFDPQIELETATTMTDSILWALYDCNAYCLPHIRKWSWHVSRISLCGVCDYAMLFTHLNWNCVMITDVSRWWHFFVPVHCLLRLSSFWWHGLQIWIKKLQPYLTIHNCVRKRTRNQPD